MAIRRAAAARDVHALARFGELVRVTALLPAYNPLDVRWVSTGELAAELGWPISLTAARLRALETQDLAYRSPDWDSCLWQLLEDGS